MVKIIAFPRSKSGIYDLNLNEIEHFSKASSIEYDNESKAGEGTEVKNRFPVKEKRFSFSKRIKFSTGFSFPFAGIILIRLLRVPINGLMDSQL